MSLDKKKSKKKGSYSSKRWQQIEDEFKKVATGKLKLPSKKEKKIRAKKPKKSVSKIKKPKKRRVEKPKKIKKKAPSIKKVKPKPKEKVKRERTSFRTKEEYDASPLPKSYKDAQEKDWQEGGMDELIFHGDDEKAKKKVRKYLSEEISDISSGKVKIQREKEPIKTKAKKEKVVEKKVRGVSAFVKVMEKEKPPHINLSKEGDVALLDAVDSVRKNSMVSNVIYEDGKIKIVGTDDGKSVGYLFEMNADVSLNKSSDRSVFVNMPKFHKILKKVLPKKGREGEMILYSDHQAVLINDTNTAKYKMTFDTWDKERYKALSDIMLEQMPKLRKDKDFKPVDLSFIEKIKTSKEKNIDVGSSTFNINIIKRYVKLIEKYDGKVSVADGRKGMLIELKFPNGKGHIAIAPILRKKGTEKLTRHTAERKLEDKPLSKGIIRGRGSGAKDKETAERYAKELKYAYELMGYKDVETDMQPYGMSGEFMVGITMREKTGVTSDNERIIYQFVVKDLEHIRAWKQVASKDRKALEDIISTIEKNAPGLEKMEKKVNALILKRNRKKKVESRRVIQDEIDKHSPELRKLTGVDIINNRKIHEMGYKARDLLTPKDTASRWISRKKTDIYKREKFASVLGRGFRFGRKR